MTDLGLHPMVEREYKRWCGELGSDEPQHPLALRARDVLTAHFLVASHFHHLGQGIGGIGPKNLHLLHSAISRQAISFGGRDKWSSLYDVVATLFFGLIKNHPFHDANKRTALLTALYHLQSNGCVVSIHQREFEDLAVRVADNELRYYPAFRDLRKREDPEVLFLSGFFRRGTRAINKREFRITNRQLAVVLGRFGFRIEPIGSNRAHVLKSVEEKHGLFGKRTRMVPHRIATIGFRDWGTEASHNDLREARRATGLTMENGYDTDVLMQGLNPMEVLIAEYREPLRRLAKR